MFSEFCVLESGKIKLFVLNSILNFMFLKLLCVALVSKKAVLFSLSVIFVRAIIKLFLSRVIIVEKLNSLYRKLLTTETFFKLIVPSHFKLFKLLKICVLLYIYPLLVLKSSLIYGKKIFKYNLFAVR